MSHRRNGFDAGEAGTDRHARLAEPGAMRLADPSAARAMRALPDRDGAENRRQGQGGEEERARTRDQWSSRAKVRSQRQECLGPLVSTKPARSYNAINAPTVRGLTSGTLTVIDSRPLS